MLENVLSEIVTLEYSLMRCILGASASHWQVGVPTKQSIYFWLFNFLCISGICHLIMKISWKKNIRKRFIRDSYLSILSYEMYWLGRLLLIDMVGASLQNQLFISDLFFLVILDFVFSLWKFVEKKMLGNILLEMVTLEYFLVRCILGASASHWQVVVPTKPSIHFSFLIFFVDFFWNSVTFSWQGNSGGNLYTFDILSFKKNLPFSET